MAFTTTSSAYSSRNRHMNDIHMNEAEHGKASFFLQATSQRHSRMVAVVLRLKTDFYFLYPAVQCLTYSVHWTAMYAYDKRQHSGRTGLSHFDLRKYNQPFGQFLYSIALLRDVYTTFHPVASCCYLPPRQHVPWGMNRHSCAAIAAFAVGATPWR